MAKGRMLKKNVSTSRRLPELKSDTCRLLYTWMIPHLDIKGRFSANPYIVKGSVVPRLKHITIKRIEDCLLDMHEKDVILLYEIDEDKYLELKNFEKHQSLKPEREAKSEIPDPHPDLIRSKSGLVRTQVKLREVKLRECKIKKDKSTYSDNKLEFSDLLKKYPLFNKFYSLYPKRVSGRKALISFKKINLTNNLLDIILKDIEKKKKCEQWQENKFIPNPTTYLNQKRWEDEESKKNDFQYKK